MKKVNVNLIPDIENSTPDYYCTWQTQLYATSGGTPKMQKEIIGERQLFGEEKPYGWAYFYELARKDLFLVMDDSWDVPSENEENFFGSLILDKRKFPESTAGGVSNAEALKRLTDRVKALGWKGLGGWVCAQEAPALFKGDIKEYWIERLKAANVSGFAYWKVDWGAKAGDIEFRKMLTELGKQYAPKLIIEHAMTKEIIPCSDVYRTYDVPAIMSIPFTMRKVADCAVIGITESEYKGLVNCEDEAYVAAAGGFPMGIMRHAYIGDFPNGNPDCSFPTVHRNIKSKSYEVLRAARWHRIAPAFGIDKYNTYVSEAVLSDTWKFENKRAEIEQWWFKMDMVSNFVENDVLTISAPAVIARGCELPIITPDGTGDVPYVIASKNPNGVFSVATLGRTLDRRYYIPKCDVFVNAGDADTIGVFGEYKNLIINTDIKRIKTLLLQDIAADEAYDVTADIDFFDDKITIPGELLSRVCCENQLSDDTSEPGAVLKILS